MKFPKTVDRRKESLIQIAKQTETTTQTADTNDERDVTEFQ